MPSFLYQELVEEVRAVCPEHPAFDDADACRTRPLLEPLRRMEQAACPGERDPELAAFRKRFGLEGIGLSDALLSVDGQVERRELLAALLRGAGFAALWALASRADGTQAQLVVSPRIHRAKDPIKGLNFYGPLMNSRDFGLTDDFTIGMRCRFRLQPRRLGFQKCFYSVIFESPAARPKEIDMTLPLRPELNLTACLDRVMDITGREFDPGRIQDLVYDSPIGPPAGPRRVICVASAAPLPRGDWSAGAAMTGREIGQYLTAVLSMPRETVALASTEFMIKSKHS